VCGSGVVVCSWSLLIRWAQRAHCQAETPLIVLSRFPGPALHTPDHGPEFIQNLPHIIGRIEAGDAPFKQAGDYDLNLDLWIDRDDQPHLSGPV
jgi:hypothetical protein